MNFQSIFDLLKNIDAVKPLFEQTYNPIVITSSQLELPGPQIIYANKAFCENTGYSIEELLGETPRILQGELTDREVLDRLKTTLLKGEFFQGNTINYRKDGSQYWVEWNISPIYDTNNELSCYFCVQHDITAQKELELYKTKLETMVEEKASTIVSLNEEIESTLHDTLFTMGEIAEAKSKETGFHVKRVSKYVELLCLKHGLTQRQSNLVGIASSLHDVGKIAINDNILNKPAKLTSEEFEHMREHAQYGYDMLKNSKREIFQTASIIALSHHEKYDGSGYPFGLSGEDIHLYGRIVAIADVFDALGSDRCYKKAWSDEKVLEFFKNQKGKHFDPQLVDLFFENLDEFMDIRSRYKEVVLF